MRVTIVGAGQAGRALAEGMAGAGHEVTIAVRTPAEGARPITGAAEGADVVVLAVPFQAVSEAVTQLDPAPGTVLVDATNPFGQPVPSGYASGAAMVSAAAPDCRVVKAFNVVGAEHMADPRLASGHSVLLPVCGDDAEARAAVLELARSIGFDAIDVGGLEAAATLEHAAAYWGLLAYAGGLGRNFALVAVPRG